MIALASIIALLLEYKYALLFPIALVEGPMVSILGGFLASSHFLNVYLVLLVVLAGDLIFDSIYYGLGRYGGTRVIKKYGRYLRINRKQVTKLERHFHSHTGKTLFIAKFTHGLGWAVLFSAGVAKVPYKKFILNNFCSAALKSTVLVIFGYYYGYAYQRISEYFGYASYIFAGLAVILIITYLLVMRRVKEQLL
jgi:membrane protein DedA with SNARE-associated domain